MQGSGFVTAAALPHSQTCQNAPCETFFARSSGLTPGHKKLWPVRARSASRTCLRRALPRHSENFRPSNKQKCSICTEFRFSHEGPTYLVNRQAQPIQKKLSKLAGFPHSEGANRGGFVKSLGGSTEGKRGPAESFSAGTARDPRRSALSFFQSRSAERQRVSGESGNNSEFSR